MIVTFFFISRQVYQGGDSLNDSHIIDLYFQRDETAIKQTNTKYGALCRYISNNIISNPQDSEECVNDAYYKLWNTIPPTKPQNLKAYICRIIRNISIDLYRKRKTSNRPCLSFDNVIEELDIIFSQHTLDEEVDIRQLGKTIDQFLEATTKSNRIIFVRRYFFGDSIKDIANRLSLSENNIKVNLYRSRENLKKALKKEGYDL